MASQRLLVVIFFAAAAAVNGYPFHIPACLVGNPAVFSSHLTRNVTTGGLAQGGFVVSIDGIALRPNVTHVFDTHKAYNVVVKGIDGEWLKGAFLRIALNATDVDIKDSLLPLPPYTKAYGCENSPIAGISHSEPSVKSNVTAILQMDTPESNITFDVTIVVVNNVSLHSIFYYDQFTLESVVGPATATPSKAPSQLPTATPSKVPTKEPTLAPTTSLVELSTKAPTKTPVRIAPSKVPVGSISPSQVPTKSNCVNGVNTFCPFKICVLWGSLFDWWKGVDRCL